MKKGLEERLIETLKIDKQFLPYFTNINENKFAKDKIIDISGTTFQLDLCEYPINNVVPFRYGLVLVNLSNNHVYGEAIERKDADSVLAGLKRIMTRQKPVIKRLQTDRGGEFVNAKMKKYCEDNDIFLYTYNLYNKNSMGPVERMIGLISKLIYTQLSILTVKEKSYNANITDYHRDWVNMFKKSIATINQYFKEKFPIENKYTLFDIYNQKIKTDKKMFRIGDTVYLRIKQPRNIIDNSKFFAEKWRYGDLRFDPAKPRKITNIFVKSGRIVRYVLDNEDNVTYKMSDLLKK